MYNKSGEGVAKMCKIMEDMRNEAAREAVRKTTKENARRLLKLGKIKIDEVSDRFPDLLDSDIKELEKLCSQLMLTSSFAILIYHKLIGNEKNKDDQK